MFKGKIVNGTALGSVNQHTNPWQREDCTKLPKLVVNLYWDNVGGWMGDKRMEASLLSKRKYYKHGMSKTVKSRP